jgi:hypothetical protein
MENDEGTKTVPSYLHPHGGMCGCHHCCDFRIVYTKVDERGMIMLIIKKETDYAYNGQDW